MFLFDPLAKGLTHQLAQADSRYYKWILSSNLLEADFPLLSKRQTSFVILPHGKSVFAFE